MPKQSKLDKHRKEIIYLIGIGVSKTNIAKQYNICRTGLYHWINNGGLVQDDRKELTKTAEIVANRVVTSLSNELYRLCSREMEDLEHKGVWEGNGHHAAQKIHTEIMEELGPKLEAVIKAMVLR